MKIVNFSESCSDNTGRKHFTRINKNRENKRLSEGKDKQIDLLNVRYIDPDNGLTNCNSYTNNNSQKNNEIKDGKPLLWPQLVAALVFASVHLGVGVIGGFTGIILPALTNPNSTDIFLTTEQSAIFSSIAFVGIIAGAFVSGIILTRLGQRITVILSLIAGICGWILLTNSSNIIILVSSRFIMGILGGAGAAPCSTYIAEISHTTLRARLLAMIDLSRQIGFTLISVMGSTRLHWRLVGILCGLLTLVSPLIFIYFLPNSPRWLATQGRKKEAKKSLEFFRGHTYNVDGELNEIFQQLEGANNVISLIDQIKMFRNKKLLKRIIVLLLLIICYNLIGSSVIASYTVTIFNYAETGINEYLSTTVSTSMRILGSGSYLLMADKINKKVLLIIPLSLLFFSITSLGVYFYMHLHYPNIKISWLPLTAMIIYLYAIGLSVPGIMLQTSELIPTSVRSFGSSVIFLIYAITMFSEVFSFPYLIKLIGIHWLFWFYGINALIVIFIVFFYIPETKGKSLEEIGDLI